MSEIIFILLIILVLIIGFLYWVRVSNNEYNRIVKRLKEMPMVAAILVFFGIDD